MAKIGKTGIGGDKGLSLKGGQGTFVTKKSNDTSVSKSQINIKHTQFTDALNEISINFEKKELQETLDDINDLGKRLMRSPNFELLEEYKTKIKYFLQEALKRIYKVDTKNSTEMLGRRQKVFVNVDKIDENLESLALKFIKNQEEAINVIKEIEEIKGLLYSILA